MQCPLGIGGDLTARAAAISGQDRGNAVANALAFGLISRTSNGGSSRIAVGPGQAFATGFAISGGGLPSSAWGTLPPAALHQVPPGEEGRGEDEQAEGQGNTGKQSTDGDLICRPWVPVAELIVMPDVWQHLGHNPTLELGCYAACLSPHGSRTMSQIYPNF